MPAYLKTQFIFIDLGHPDFLHSFFSSICFHLENKKWGSRFPKIMNGLYTGLLKNNDFDEALEELKEIESSLEKVSSKNAI